MNIAHEEGQITVSFTSELNWDAPAFAQDCRKKSTGRNHLNEELDIPITPAKRQTEML